jgi:hypothetical protein
MLRTEKPRLQERKEAVSTSLSNTATRRTRTRGNIAIYFEKISGFKKLANSVTNMHTYRSQPSLAPLTTGVRFNDSGYWLSLRAGV